MDTETDTPRTDHEEQVTIGLFGHGGNVPVEFARDLERELATLTKRYEALHRMSFMSASELCRTHHIQKCDSCDDLACGDNTSPAKRDLAALTTDRDTWRLAHDLLEADKAWRDIVSAPMDVPVLLGWFETWPVLVWRVTVDLAGHENDMPPPAPFQGTRSNGWRHGSATHWMPLPEPPKEVKP